MNRRIDFSGRKLSSGGHKQTELDLKYDRSNCYSGDQTIEESFYGSNDNI